MSRLFVGITILVITTVLGIMLLMEDCRYCDNATISWQKQIMIVNFFIWIASIVLIVSGLKERSKNIESDKQKIIKKELEKESRKEDEIKELKEKVEKLEKAKEE